MWRFQNFKQLKLSLSQIVSHPPRKIVDGIYGVEEVFLLCLLELLDYY